MTGIKRKAHETPLDGAARRFWPKVDMRGPDECWPWLGTISGGAAPGKRKGYICTTGVPGFPRHGIASRLSYVLTKGPIPAGLVVRHKCDNPICVNPGHLELGTTKDNNDDMMRRGRRRVAVKYDSDLIEKVRSDPRNGAEVAKAYGLNHSYVCQLKRGLHRQARVEQDAVATSASPTAWKKRGTEGKMRAWRRTLIEMTVIERDPERDAHIVASGIQVWLDDERIHRCTLNTLLQLMAVSDASDVKGLERYRINELGRALAKRPELAVEIGAALAAGGAWTVSDDRIVPLQSRQEEGA